MSSGRTGHLCGSPYFGKSYNTWNPNLKRWEQYWVDTGAGVMFFHGGLKENVMDYWTDNVPQSTGGSLLRHLQFFNLGADKVRQFSQGSTDGGKTWHTEYDFIYTRVASKPGESARNALIEQYRNSVRRERSGFAVGLAASHCSLVIAFRRKLLHEIVGQMAQV